MTCVQSAGAMTAFLDLGLDRAFDNIYCVSAGFANTSYLLSGNGYDGISIYYDLPHRNFLKFLRFWKIVNIDSLISIMQKEKPLNINEVLSAGTKVWVRLHEIQNKKPEYLEIHQHPRSYWSIMKAAMSIPYLSPGIVEIGNKKYKDGGFTTQDEVEHYSHALNQKFTDMVIIYNSYDQYQRISKYYKRKSDNILEIYPEPNWKISYFNHDPQKLKDAAHAMKLLMLSKFSSDQGNIED